MSDRLGNRNYVKQRLLGLIWLVLKKLISVEWKKAARAVLASRSICLMFPGEMNALAAPSVVPREKAALCVCLCASAQHRGSALHPKFPFLSVSCLFSLVEDVAICSLSV